MLDGLEAGRKHTCLEVEHSASGAGLAAIYPHTAAATQGAVAIHGGQGSMHLIRNPHRPACKSGVWAYTCALPWAQTLANTLIQTGTSI